MVKIKKGDLVQVIIGVMQECGGDCGKQGKVFDVFVDKNCVIVEGVNYVIKYICVGQMQCGIKIGGFEIVEVFIYILNVVFVDFLIKKLIKVGYWVEEQMKDGVKCIVCVCYVKKSGKDF